MEPGKMTTTRRLMTSIALFTFLELATTAVAQQPAPKQPAPQIPIRVREIDWARARQDAQAPTSPKTQRFITLNRQAIDTLRLPVLLPKDPDLASSLRLFPRGDSYTVSAKLARFAFTLTGSRQAFHLPPDAVKTLPPGGLKSRVPADGILVEVNESGGIDVSQTRFGVHYSISLECADGQKDQRCANDRYVRGLISRLTVVVPAHGE